MFEQVKETPESEHITEDLHTAEPLNEHSTEGLDSGTVTEPKPDREINQEAVNAAINRQHAKYREEERKRKEAEREAEELRAKLSKLDQPETDVTIPPIPDPYDDDYEEKLKKREEAISRKAQAEFRAQAAETAKLEEQRKIDEAEKSRVEEAVKSFNANTAKLGLSAEEVTTAANTVGSYGISNDMANFLLSDAEGPLMVKYLAANPVELDEIRHMDPYSAAIKLSTEVRTKAGVLKPQVSAAPAPAEALTGGSSTQSKPAASQGVTFE